MKKIAIVQRVVTSYRVNFYNRLFDILSKKNIQLTVFAGQSLQKEHFNDGLDKVKCGKRVKNYYLNKEKIYWQNIFSELGKYDLIIVEQANSALLNFLLLFRRYFLKKGPKFAYWGHGQTLHKKGKFLNSKIKKFLSNKADYWFGYTEHTRTILNDIGVPDSTISIINNSIDISTVKNEKMKNNQKNNKDKTVVFCSRLYKNKAIPFIIDGCKIAKKEIENLNLIIIGDGPEKNNIDKLVKDKSWVTMTGSLYGQEKAKILIKGDMMALPSHVGLSILDGFAAGLPILVSDFKNHCPEIAYFDNNKNGLKTKATINDFAQGIIYLCRNPKILEKMSKNAEKTADKYTIEEMASRFGKGVINILNN